MNSGFEVVQMQVEKYLFQLPLLPHALKKITVTVSNAIKHTLCDLRRTYPRHWRTPLKNNKKR